MVRKEGKKKERKKGRKKHGFLRIAVSCFTMFELIEESLNLWLNRETRQESVFLWLSSVVQVWTDFYAVLFE